MAKITIHFNNNEYEIDNTLLSESSAALIEHLTTDMAGEGASVTFNGTSYSIDATKLNTAKANLIAHLGTISGTDKTITIDGEPYGIDATAIEDNIAGFETLLAELEAESGGEETIVLGVTGLDNSTGALTYTDDIASVAAYSTSTSGDYVSVTSELDNYFPFNSIEEFTDADNNVFIKFPKFYMKWLKADDNTITGYKISNTQADEDYFIPDAFLDPKDTTGATYLDYFALGKYEASGSSSKMYSKSGATCLVSITRAAAREAARAYGTADTYYAGYQQLDFAQLIAYNLLCMMYYGTANIQNVYGGRTGSVQSWSEASVTGTCDGVTGLNGWSTATDCVKMLGIENPFGNVFKWVDGVFFSGATIYAHRYPQQFADSTTDGISLGFSRPTSNGYISKLQSGTADTTKSYAYASEASGSATTYYGDQCFYGMNGTVLFTGGYWVYPSLAGLWCLHGSDGASAAFPTFGARLSYRPV